MRKMICNWAATGLACYPKSGRLRCLSLRHTWVVFTLWPPSFVLKVAERDIELDMGTSVADL